MTLKHIAPQARDFDATTRAALLAAGIRIIGVQALPVNGSYMLTETGYVVDDNGTGRVWNRGDVLRAVATNAAKREDIEPEPYKVIEGQICRWVGGMYRFYCYPSSWAISPAARSGCILEGI
jgi:hypothetical protein